ncbi:hypothetical protein HYPSUDRAFT_1073693 [Hypholoma sublateritium FD-334 SS-4]|uniref:Cytochrome P450 n=1 Tax=Hypholoma sublateritium (strain FD-334 SS-4) TaxID=945553 RepID=A0A0D2P1W6_HYPSF|nr:hypothetical protein HYPSUDRAFT_1073693 [Hypholoma sublateritium FD-334 SS-4]
MDSIETSHIALVGGTILLVLLGMYIGARPKAGYKTPPGPRGLPILGNALQLPNQHLGSYFRSLLETYGGLVSLNLAGTPVILIGDMAVAKDLLEKRAAKFSARPKEYYFVRYIDPNQSYWAFHDQTEGFNVGRKLTTGIMSSVRAGLTEPLQKFESLLTLQHLLDDGGKNWARHLYRVPASTNLTAMFGIHCPTGDEPEQHEIMSAAEEFITLCTPTSSIINMLPFLDWLPGPMPWRTRAKAFRKRDGDLYEKLVREAVSGTGSGMNTWAAEFARGDKPEGNQSRFMNQFASAAIETTAVALQTFVLACIMYPDWMHKVQEQIDDIVGPDRLPSFADRSRLPYVEAAVRETLRWRPAARFGVPHQSIADDVIEYNGEQYFIPAGASVFAVTWAIEHDPARYVDPDSFNPERFLDDKGQLRSNYETSAFGFGRRMCPGIPFAERTLWIEIAMLLWTFNIRKTEKPSAETGLAFQYSDSDEAFTGDITNTPHEFPVVFEPRSVRHAEVARQEWEGCEKDLNVLLPATKE